MDVLQVFHMNKGEGEASYAKNCIVQSMILSYTKPFVENAVHDYFKSSSDVPDTMAIVDLGCSSGPNALMAMKEVIDAVSMRCMELGASKSPKFMVYLNDLPGNDFNEVFASLDSFKKKLKKEKGADFGPCYIAGLPGSFYGRLFPTQSLHFVHSSSSLHWLSKVPLGVDAKDNPRIPNKGKIYISKTSPRKVMNAYKFQFQKDFMTFLKSRSEEVIPGGRMVLTFMGRSSMDFPTEESCFPWDFIAQSLMSMVSEGLIEEELVDSLNVPYYAPCIKEVKELIEEESSFRGDHFEAIELEWDGGSNMQEEYDFYTTTQTRGERLAKMHRAVSESMLEHHFGAGILDELFQRYSRILDKHLESTRNSKFIYLVISLTRK